MNTKKYILILLCFLPKLNADNYPKLTKFFSIEFDEAMGNNSESRFNERYLQSLGNTGYVNENWDQCCERGDLPNFYKFFIDLYNKNHPKNINPKAKLKIPRIIHQIWIGGPFPGHMEGWRESFKKMMPNWQIILWNDKMIEEFGLENKDLYDRTTNYGERADIARYEILNRLGGLYLDVDCECLNPIEFELFNRNYDLYVAFQPLDVGYFGLGIGVIGSIPNHPILQETIAQLKNTKDLERIIERTGPIHFTKMFHKMAQTNNLKNIAFPATFFYCIGTTDGQVKKEFIRPETAVLHYYSASWS